MKYRLLIAEDEEIDRIGLHLLLSNEFPELEIMEDAINGIEFVKMAEKEHIDIAIVDIDMPGISGIEAIRLLRKLGCQTKIIMNTAYNEFDYAVEALKLQVNDFVVKPIRRVEIIQTITKCIAELEEESIRDDRIRNRDTIISNLIPIVSNEFIMSVVTNSIKKNKVPMYSSLLDISLESGFIISCRVQTLSINGNSIESSSDEIYQAISLFISQIGRGIVGGFRDSVLSAYIACGDDSDSAEVRHWAYSFSELLVKKLQSEYGLEMQIGIGDISSDSSDISLSYSQSLTALENAVPGSVFFFRDLESFGAKHKNIDSETALSSIVNQAVQYIMAHYQNDLSLEFVGDELNVSMSHLSRIFKQEVGMNYIDFLTQFRVGKAKELIENRSLSVKQISKLVGYKNHTYFSKIFKKVVSMTPNEYRQELGRQGHENLVSD